MASPASASVRLLAGDKEPVRVAATANLALAGLVDVDGVALAVGDRVLVKNQTEPKLNGIWIASEGIWRRAPDSNTERLLIAGMKVAVQSGTEHGGDIWVLVTDRPDIGSDAIVWEFYLSTGMVDDINQAIETGLQTIGDASDDLLSTLWAATNAADYASVKVAELLDIPTGLGYVRVAGYAVSGDGGKALYKKVVSEPSHPGKFQSDDGAWWELRESEISPQMFGTIGVSAASDTAILNAMFDAAESLSIKKVIIAGDYELAGSVGGSFENVAVACANIDGLTVDLSGATFQVTTGETQAFSFDNCDRVFVHGGSFRGYAYLQIANMEAPTDWQPIGVGGGSYNGASYLYFENCTGVKVRNVYGYRNAGHDIFTWKSNDIDIQGCDLEGIGSGYIDPIDNGSDFGIVCYPPEYPSQGPTLRANISNNKVRHHALGVQVVASQTLTLHGNTIGPCPGQHGVYGIELDSASVVGNHFFDCYQFAFKNQLENYAGTYWVTTAWATGANYVIGDERVAFNTVYTATTNHTGAASFATDRDAGRWKVSEKMRRKGGNISGNTVERCGGGFGVTNGGGLVNALEAYVDGLTVSNNTILDGIADGTGNGDGISLDRVLRATVSGNTIIRSGRYGIYVNNFGGSIVGNTIHESLNSGILAVPCYNMQVKDNTLENCAKAVGATQPILFGNWPADTTLPSHLNSMYIDVIGNSIRYFSGDSPGGDATSDNLMFFDTRHLVNLFNNRSNSAKTIRVDGTLSGKFGNSFSGGFVSGGQQTVYTVTNRLTDRTYDANSTDAAELADVIGTFIEDIKTYAGFQ